MFNDIWELKNHKTALAFEILKSAQMTLEHDDPYI
jgi:hypothetical protein